MTTRRTTVVGVFSDKTLAERAIDALKDAGFSNDEIRYSGSGGGGFFDNLKSWLSGDDASGTTGEIADDLKSMGVPDSEANYYSNEYAAGHPIVAVRSPGHENDALSILRSNGSSHYNMGSGAMGAGAAGAAATGTAASSYANRGKDYTNTPETGSRTGYTQPADRTSGSTASSMTGGMASGKQKDAMDRTSASGRTTETGMAGKDRGTTGSDAQSIRLREEQLRAEKQRVQSGEVDVHKRVVEEQKNIDVPVRHEELVVERKPIVEPRPTDIPVGQDETIRIPLSEEQVNVTKTPVETEEISLRKRNVEEQQHITGTVRREEADIESSGDAPIRDENDKRRGL